MQTVCDQNAILVKEVRREPLGDHPIPITNIGQPSVAPAQHYCLM